MGGRNHNGKNLERKIVKIKGGVDICRAILIDEIFPRIEMGQKLGALLPCIPYRPQ